MSDVEHCFMCLLAVYMYSLEKRVYFFCPLFDWVVCFSGIELHELLVYFWRLIPLSVVSFFYSSSVTIPLLGVQFFLKTFFN